MQETYQQSAQDVLASLHSSPSGLTAEEAAARLDRHGPNKLQEAPKATLLQRFFQQLKDPMLLILMAAAAVSMLGGFAVLGGMDFSGLEMIVFCLTGIAVLFLAAQKGAPAREKRNYTGVFVVLMLSKLGASGWAGDICSALVWPALLATEYERGKPIQRQLQLVSAAEVLRLVFWMLTKYAGMSGLAFWTNIMFVLLTCARGWAGLTLYKTQEETL